MVAINERHAHPEMRLGRRKPDPRKPRLRASKYLNAMPSHSPEVDHLKSVPEFGMYRNDAFGVCGPTMLANSRRLVTSALTGSMVAPSQDSVFDLYRRSGNPNFDPNTGADDNGVVLQDMLSAAARGGLDGTQVLGFAEVDHTDLEAMRATIEVFGFLCIGVNLEVAQQSQTRSGLWDFMQSGDWGGHAVLGGAFRDLPSDSADRMKVISWAEGVDLTDAFIAHQLDEAWAVIWPEHLLSKRFVDNMDTATFAADYKAITGRDFPAALPTPPAARDTIVLDPVNTARVRRVAGARGTNSETWLNKHLHSYFGTK